jgi:hypothetical protein
VYLNGPEHMCIIKVCSDLYANGSGIDWYAIKTLVINKSRAGFAFGGRLEDSDDMSDRAL